MELTPMALTTYNPLVWILGLLVATGGAAIAYLVAELRGNEEEVRKGFGITFFLLGILALVGFIQLLWTNWASFPALQYKELFGTATGFLAFVLLGVGALMMKGQDLKPIALPAALLGLVLFQGARAVTTFSLTRNPGMTFLLWLAAGLSAVGLLPYAYTPKGSQIRRVIVIIGLIVLALMTLLAFLTAYNAYFGHIASIMEKMSE